MSTDKPEGKWLKVFCPDARCLSDAEVASLPEEKKKAMADKDGLWLDVFCPDGSCATGPEHFWVPVESSEGGVWLKTFCPDDSCVVSEPTDLP
jgi:hypothetical protein